MIEERRKSGVYGSCTYHENSLKDIAQWLQEHDDLIPCPISIDQIHTTVIYSRANFEIPHNEISNFSSNIEDFKFSPSGFAIFGQSTDEKKALVMLLDAEPLINLHQTLLNNGAIHGFNDYTPHLTISYDTPENFDISQINVPTFSLQPTKLNFEPLNLNWCLQDDKPII